MSEEWRTRAIEAAERDLKSFLARGYPPERDEIVQIVVDAAAPIIRADERARVLTEVRRVHQKRKKERSSG